MWELWLLGERLRVARAYLLVQDSLAVLRFGLRLERELSPSDANAFLVGLEALSADLADAPEIHVVRG